MIIKFSGGIANGGGIDMGDRSVKTGDGIRVTCSGLPNSNYKVYANGVAREVDGRYVTASNGLNWVVRGEDVIDL